MNINVTLFGEAIAFALLIWFCVRFIWPPLLNAIEERQRKIADGLDAAERARAELKQADAQVADEVRKARQQASEIVDKAHQQAGQIVDKARSDAQAEAGRQRANAESEIAAMTERAREQLRGQVAQLAVLGAQQILQREIDPAAHKALLDQLATELQAS
ncbi:MAG TPA: F0F1 ATP synthase subunit B [Rhodanobacteraceae bacterium]|nr:F0F1 ATP synthase subunit B [Rhodanobacteraceae bacterium]